MKKAFFVSVALLLGMSLAYAQAVKPFGQGKVLKILVSNVEADDKDFNNGVEDFPILQQFEALTGVKLEIETAADYGALLLPRLAAKTNLPDLFVMGGNFDIVKLANDGVIQPLDALINKVAPETVQLMKDLPVIKKDITATDGHIYGYPGRVSQYDNRFNILGIGYRADWAAQVGVGDPKTIADWEKMLTLFRDKIPGSIPYAAGYSNNLNSFAQSWGLSPWNDWWSVDAKGKVNFDFYSADTIANMKDFLTTMNRWYKAKLIDNEFPNEHGDAIDAKTLTDKVGARLAWTAAFDDWNAQMKKDYPNVAWTVAYPPKGPTGLASSEQYGPVNNERWMVSKTSKNAELAVQFLNFVFATKTGADLMNWGIRGVSYNVAKDGTKAYTQEALKSHYGDGNVGSYLASLGASRWPHTFPLDAFAAQLPTLTQGYKDRLADMDKMGMFRRGFYFGSLPSTPAESDALGKTKYNDIKTLISEKMAKFIIGTESLSTYDAFVAQLKTLGIEDVIKIKQAQYTRYAK